MCLIHLCSKVGIAVEQAAIKKSDELLAHAYPFQDGNGKVGSLVVLNECLHHGIIPFLIKDTKKDFYYWGISEWRSEKGWLTDPKRVWTGYK